MPCGLPSPERAFNDIAVLTNPGYAMDIRILCPTNSARKEEKNPPSACLEAEYAVLHGAPMSPAMLEMHKIMPEFLESMPGMHARAMSTEARKLVSIIRSNTAGSVLINRER